MNRVSMYIFVVIADLAILHSSLRIVCAETKAHAEQGLIGTVHAAFQRPGELPSEEGYSSWGWPVNQEQTIRKSFSADAAHPAKTIAIDNFSGAIEVTGGDSDEVQMVVNEKIRARSKEDAQKAFKDVSLQITQPENSIRVYVDGPFPRDCGNLGFFGDDRPYDVEMNFILTVPRNMNLDLKTVNAPHISVKDLSGRYRIRNVNGAIEMLNVGGSGEVHTINGDVTVSFRGNPTEDSSFGSINGRVELSFAPKLSADLRLSSFSGSIYSDFPLKNSDMQGNEQLNAFAMGPSFRHASGVVGAGGPEIRAETMSGDIRVRENHE
jgi:hypothetical protein